MIFPPQDVSCCGQNHEVLGKFEVSFRRVLPYSRRARSTKLIYFVVCYYIFLYVLLCFPVYFSGLCTFPVFHVVCFMFLYSNLCHCLTLFVANVLQVPFLFSW